jgi:hypothetical protein
MASSSRNGSKISDVLLGAIIAGACTIIAAVITVVFWPGEKRVPEINPVEPTLVATIIAERPTTSVEVLDTTVRPTETLKPEPIKEPIPLTQLHIPGYSSRGIEYDVRESGRYLFRYVSGAYSTNDPNRKETWLTTILIYRNTGVQWAEDGRIKDELAFLKLAEHYYFPSQEEAATIATANAMGDTLEADLTSGDRLALVAVDGHSYYTDNLGEIVIDVFFRTR